MSSPVEKEEEKKTGTTTRTTRKAETATRNTDVKNREREKIVSFPYFLTNRNI